MRRIIVTTVVFLLAGAIVNVAVAWGCCRLGKPVFFSFTQGVSRSDQQWLYAQLPTDQECARPAFTRIRGGFGDEYHTVVVMVEDGRPGDAIDGTRARVGWPCFSLGFSYFTRLQTDPPGSKPREIASKSFGLIMLPAWLSTQYGFAEALPANVLWPGFAVNTVFYAAVLWLLIPGPFALRRVVRRRRGLCVKCGYPMGETGVCSECGAALNRTVTS